MTGKHCKRTHRLAAKDEQVRVLCNDAIDDAVLLEVAKLRVGFVRRDDVRDVFPLQFLDELSLLHQS